MLRKLLVAAAVLSYAPAGFAGTTVWTQTQLVGPTKVTFFQGAGFFNSGVRCATDHSYQDPDAKIKFWIATLDPTIPFIMPPNTATGLGELTGSFQVSAIVNGPPPNVIRVSCAGVSVTP